jgi:hypothetical protein
MFGNAGRNVFRGSGLTNYNFSIFRSFGLPDKFKLEFRGETYNLTNTPHFARAGNGRELARFRPQHHAATGLRPAHRATGAPARFLNAG